MDSKHRHPARRAIHEALFHRLRAGLRSAMPWIPPGPDIYDRIDLLHFHLNRRIDHELHQPLQHG